MYTDAIKPEIVKGHCKTHGVEVVWEVESLHWWRVNALCLGASCCIDEDSHVIMREVDIDMDSVDERIRRANEA